MNKEQLEKKKVAVTENYRTFLEQVRSGFNQHCDEIKAKATQRFNSIPQNNEAARKQVLADQKLELDKTLAELKQLLAQKATEVRTQLEEIASLQDQADFNLDEALVEVAELEKAAHAA